MVGLYLVLVIMAIAILTPFIAPFDPDAIEVGPKLAPPSVEHWMGTDEFRRDMFSRGAVRRPHLALDRVRGGGHRGDHRRPLVGSVAGYFGGCDRSDHDVVHRLDPEPSRGSCCCSRSSGLFRAAGAQGLFLIVTILGLTGWMGVARIVRSQVLSLKEQDFIQATKALGLPHRSRAPHPPASRTRSRPVIVFARSAIGGHDPHGGGACAFLGLGVPPPTATWGSIVNDGREYLRSRLVDHHVPGPA